IYHRTRRVIGAGVGVLAEITFGTLGSRRLFLPVNAPVLADPCFLCLLFSLVALARSTFAIIRHHLGLSSRSI
ncbi:hypothetical protein, partial [Roseiconus nitratireducens]|uniref:hypothetical protein n=1 Tax=Roseiconus nitratireducens TaxID=2605748 RepID=UPI001F1FF049